MMMRRSDASHNDYFESRYNFSGESDGCSVTMNLTSKCQDVLKTAPNDDGTHRRVRETAKEEICAECDVRTPQSLQKLTCVKILTSEKLLNTAVRLLPASPLFCMMDVAVNCLPSQAAAGPIRLLLEHWPCHDFNMGLISTNHTDHCFVSCLVVDHFVADLNARILNRTTASKLTEFVMTNERKSNCLTLFRKLFDVAYDKRMSVAGDGRDRACTPTYIITTDLALGKKRSLRSVVTTLRKFRRQACPVELRIRDIRLDVINLFDTASLVTEINPAFVKSFSTTLYQGSDQLVLELDEILRPMVELTSLQLTLDMFGVAEQDPLEAEKLGNAVSLLLGHHPTIKTLTLKNFPITEHGDKYHLPPMLEELHLYYCEMTHAVFQHWADTCSTSKLKVVNITDCILIIDPFNDDGFVKFLEKHAETLVSLSIDMEPPPMSIAALTRFAKDQSRFKSLKDFSYVAGSRLEVLATVRDAIPWLSTYDGFQSFSLRCNVRPVTDDDDDFRDDLERSLKAVCRSRIQRTPIRSAALAYKTKLDHYPLIYIRFDNGGAGAYPGGVGSGNVGPGGVGGVGGGVDGAGGGAGGGVGVGGLNTGMAADDDDSDDDDADDIPVAGNPHDHDDFVFNADEEEADEVEEEEEDFEHF